MINIDTLITNINKYIIGLLDTIALSNPMIKIFLKPIISRVIINNTDKIKDVLKYLTDKDGNIDIEGMLDDIIVQIRDNPSFKTDIPFLGESEIGGGLIKLNVPIINKNIVFNIDDLENCKNTLIQG